MNDKVAFSLLKKAYRYDKHLSELDHIIITENLGFDVVDDAFDLLGVPAENPNCESPEFFERDYLHDNFYDLKDGTDEEIQEFINYVKAEAIRMKKVIENDWKALKDGQDLGRPGR